MKKVILSAFTVFSFSLFAGKMDYTCKNKTNTIVMDSLAPKTEGTIEIHYKKNGKDEIYKSTLALMPFMDNNRVVDKKTLLAIPTSNARILAEKCKEQHVVQFDGNECFGRQTWEVVIERPYIITSSSGDAILTSDFLGENSIVDVDGQTTSSYIYENFSCTNSGVSTAGGCHALPNSKVDEWVPTDCARFRDL